MKTEIPFVILCQGVDQREKWYSISIEVKDKEKVKRDLHGTKFILIINNNLYRCNDVIVFLRPGKAPISSNVMDLTIRYRQAIKLKHKVSDKIIYYEHPNDLDIEYKMILLEKELEPFDIY